MMAKNRQQQVALITSTFIVYVLQSIKPENLSLIYNILNHAPTEGKWLISTKYKVMYLAFV